MRGFPPIRTWLPAIGTAVPLVVLRLVILTLVLAAARQFELSQVETMSWLIAVIGLPAALSIFLSLRHRLPLTVGGNILVILFVTSLAQEFTFSELIGAAMIAGVVIMGLTVAGVADRIRHVVPIPIVYGLLAGVLAPYVIEVFSLLQVRPWIIAGAIVAYVLGQRFLPAAVPAILPALAAGLAIAAALGELNLAPRQFPAPDVRISLPDFSLEAAVTATPVIVILVLMQSTIPSVIYLQAKDFPAPAKTLNYVSGVFTTAGSLLGPAGIGLSLPYTSLAAAPEAGPHQLRHRPVYISGIAILLLMPAVGAAAGIAEAVPMALLMAVVGLAVITVLADALRHVVTGPLRFGPVFAFVVAQSELSLFGLGPFFWALVAGSLISAVLESNGLRQLRGDPQDIVTPPKRVGPQEEGR
ncbi:permease family protein [Arthrobacter pigmenti]